MWQHYNLQKYTAVGVSEFEVVNVLFTVQVKSRRDAKTPPSRRLLKPVQVLTTACLASFYRCSARIAAQEIAKMYGKEL